MYKSKYLHDVSSVSIVLPYFACLLPITKIICCGYSSNPEFLFVFGYSLDNNFFLTQPSPPYSNHSSYIFTGSSDFIPKIQTHVPYPLSGNTLPLVIL